MNVETIQRELQARLKAFVHQTYSTPQAAVDPPCAVIGIPTVETFHVVAGTNLCRSNWEVTMHAGRGDTPDAMARLAQWLSNDGDLSFVAVLEAESHAWNRLTVTGTQALNTNAETVSITFNLTIDA